VKPKYDFMNRRELLKMIAVLTGGAVVGAEAFLTGCKNSESVGGLTFTEQDIAFLDEVGETILPATQTPGAKAAHIGQFMKTIVNDCYEEADQKIFHEGIGKLNDASDKKFGHPFIHLSPEQKHELLVELDKDVKKQRDDFKKAQDQKQADANARGDKDFKREKLATHYFTLMKQLTLWGYFTSEEGVTKALRFNPVPGRYDGCIDYKKGDRMFSKLG
jgi:hypothetical protein